jgi:HK97 family phage prohead protease
MRIEIRSDSVVLTGYVNVTARESRVLPSPSGRFVEEILPKTFERALNSADNVDLLFNHDRNRKLGSTQEGNLELYEDNIGLRATATILDEQVRQKAVSGELRGWSFGFQALKDSWKTREDGMQKRSVEELRLFEVSVLDKTPAYIATSVEMRGEEEIMSETRQIEDSTEIINSAEINKTENSTKTKKQEERTVPEPYYFEHLQLEKTLLELGGFR